MIFLRRSKPLQFSLGKILEQHNVTCRSIATCCCDFTSAMVAVFASNGFGLFTQRTDAKY